MLSFEKITLENMGGIYPYLQLVKSRTCDFTIGGIYMWIDYFNYSYCIYNDTLFIKGLLEGDMNKVAFAVPVGRMPLVESVAYIEEYCNYYGLEPCYSAVPEEYVEELVCAIKGGVHRELPDWGDYLYSAVSLVTLEGHKLNKKRNRVNKFLREYPIYQYHRLSAENVAEVKQFMIESFRPQCKQNDMSLYECDKVIESLDNYTVLSQWGYSGGLISVEGKVVAFAMGEVIGDTLYVHVEKALYEYAGAYETINNCYARDCTQIYPHIKYVNREDDAGDEGLRQAKRSYNPLTILRKYDVCQQRGCAG